MFNTPAVLVLNAGLCCTQMPGCHQHQAVLVLSSAISRLPGVCLPWVVVHFKPLNPTYHMQGHGAGQEAGGACGGRGSPCRGGHHHPGRRAAAAGGEEGERMNSVVHVKSNKRSDGRHARPVAATQVCPMSFISSFRGPIQQLIPPHPIPLQVAQLRREAVKLRELTAHPCPFSNSHTSCLVCLPLLQVAQLRREAAKLRELTATPAHSLISPFCFLSLFPLLRCPSCGGRRPSCAS